MENPVIGFIGLGLMGGNMVECLQKNGIEPVIMGRNRKAVDAAVARGAREVATPREMAEACDIIMLCVTTSEVVERHLGGHQEGCRSD